MRRIDVFVAVRQSPSGHEAPDLGTVACTKDNVQAAVALQSVQVPGYHRAYPVTRIVPAVLDLAPEGRT